jgi:hypothetical protein
MKMIRNLLLACVAVTVLAGAVVPAHAAAAGHRHHKHRRK